MTTIIFGIILWALLAAFVIVLVCKGKAKQKEKDAREFRRYFNKRDGGER